MSDQLEHELHELLEALADRADGTTPASAVHLIGQARRRVRRRRVAATATGALVAAAAIVVAVVVNRTDDPTKVIGTPSPSTTELSPETTVTSTGPIGPTANDGTGPIVDVSDPPPLFAPRPFASIDVASAGSGSMGWSVAVTAQGAVVTDSDAKAALVINEATGNIERVPLDVTPLETVVVDDVLYGTVPGEQLPPTLKIVAIPLHGPQAGQVVGSADLEVNAYTEDPVGRFGLGPDGIIDRILSTTVMTYLTAEGRQSGLTPTIATLTQSESTITSSNGQSWTLDIRRHSDAADPFVGEAPPAWTSDGDAVMWTSIGPRSDPGSDFGTPTMPVIATLHPDGSVRWMRIPDDWSVASSDTSGVIIIRESAGRIELARFSDLTLKVETRTVLVGDVTLAFHLWPDGYRPTLVGARTFTGVHAGMVSTGQLTKTGARTMSPITVTVLRGLDEVAAALSNPPDAVSPLEPTQLQLNGATVYRSADPISGTPVFYSWSPQADLAITVGIPLTFPPGTASTFLAGIAATW